MKTPRFMLCSPKESEEMMLEDADYVLDSELGILWKMEEQKGTVAEWLSDPIKDPQILAEASRLAAEWIVEFYEEAAEYD